MLYLLHMLLKKKFSCDQVRTVTTVSVYCWLENCHDRIIQSDCELVREVRFKISSAKTDITNKIKSGTHFHTHTNYYTQSCLIWWTGSTASLKRISSNKFMDITRIREVTICNIHHNIWHIIGFTFSKQKSKITKGHSHSILYNSWRIYVLTFPFILMFFVYL